MTKEKARIVDEGMGGFLNPPTHPEHTHSVEFDLHRRPEHRGRMCLTLARDEDWLTDSIRIEVNAMLDAWQAPPLDSPDVHEWVLQVLGYFRDCYRNPDKSGWEQWSASHVRILKQNPLEHANDHAGVHHIRHFYPKYQPTAEDFANAYWGTKPEKKE